jgi:hypothetical protein
MGFALRTHHASITAERWRSFTLDQQILMIANEMHRAGKLLAPSDTSSRRLAYERVLRLVDLTVGVQPRRALRRELLRWRGLVAELYLLDEADAKRHIAALRVLLQTTPVAAKQIPYVIPARTW